MQGRSLGGEDPLEEEMAAHSPLQVGTLNSRVGEGVRGLG